MQEIRQATAVPRRSLLHRVLSSMTTLGTTVFTATVFTATAFTATVFTATGCSAEPSPPHTGNSEAAVSAVILREDLNQPWGMALLPDGRALITEKPGRLTLVALPGGEHLGEISGLPAVAEVGQGGLLDVAIAEDFSSAPWVYLSYVVAAEGLYGTEVGRGRLRGMHLEDFTTLFVAQPKMPGGHHFGSRLVLAPSGHLYITLGDRGERDEAQRLSSHLGSVVRIHPDGRVPEDNPFVATNGARPEIYSYGHRNIQGAALHPESGELWINEHGPQGGDEVNVVRAGANYGWPVATFGREYVTGLKIGAGPALEGTMPPLWQWTPSIAPSGMAFYTNDRIAAWQGSLLVGALKYRLLARLEGDTTGLVERERLFEGRFGRIRNVEVDTLGRVYLLTDAGDGKLIRIEAAAGPQATILE